MTDKQFRAIAHSILTNLGSAGDEPQVGFLTGALMAMHDIGAADADKGTLQPAGQGRKLVNDMMGRFYAGGPAQPLTDDLRVGPLGEPLRRVR